MSRRVTTETEMTDCDVLSKAFKTSGVSVRSLSNSTFEIRAGGSVGILDAKSGRIESDSDSFHQKDFDTLRMHYAEEKYMWELTRTGASIHSRTTDAAGNIVIVYQTA